MRVAMAQLNPTIGDIGGNVTKIRQVAVKACRAGPGRIWWSFPNWP